MQIIQSSPCNIWRCAAQDESLPPLQLTFTVAISFQNGRSSSCGGSFAVGLYASGIYPPGAEVAGSLLLSTNIASSTTTSVAYRFSPCLSVQERVWMLPVTQMADPFRKYRAINSAVCRHAWQLMKSASGKAIHKALVKYTRLVAHSPSI